MNGNAIRKLGNKLIGDGQPVYIIAEIGINHNGSLKIAKELIDSAVHAKCDAVKFQKRTPELCVPRDQWDIMRDTPWGRMPYINYRKKVEFGIDEYTEIDRYCKENGIDWFASPWDPEAVNFLQQFNPPVYKMSSASLTDDDLICRIKETGKPVIVSTGMSTIEQIEKAVEKLGAENILLAQSTSAYPCKVDNLNLKVISTYKNKFPNIPIGYSGHETGLAPTYAAVALGATFVERHITLDRALWGSDQAASVEPQGLEKLVRDIRDIELALGDGIKIIFESELESIQKLRKIKTTGKTG